MTRAAPFDATLDALEVFVVEQRFVIGEKT
jgi:hypothetical protein